MIISSHPTINLLITTLKKEGIRLRAQAWKVNEGSALSFFEGQYQERSRRVQLTPPPPPKPHVPFSTAEELFYTVFFFVAQHNIHQQENKRALIEEGEREALRYPRGTHESLATNSQSHSDSGLNIGLNPTSGRWGQRRKTRG